MKKPPLKQRVAYWFDNVMSRGVVSLVAFLFLITLAVAILVAVLAFGVDGARSGQSFGSYIWGSFMRVLDAGNLAGDTEAGNALYVTLMVLATVCGLFVTSILIGIINTAFQSKLESLRKGNSRVLEQGHTLVLGFSDHIYSIISELVVANENQKDSCIVILSEVPKEEMEDAIGARIPDTGKTRVICRSGKPTSLTDLKNVGVSQCKSILLIFEDDLDNIKAVLALSNILGSENSLHAHITAVINEEENLEAVRIAGGGLVEPLYLKDAISRILAQTCRQSGLSEVYQELFDFDGDEIYMEHIPGMAGKRFGETPMCFAQSSVMGLCRDGKILVNPPMDTVIQEEDTFIIIASDDGVTKPNSGHYVIDESAIVSAEIDARKCGPERLLILGYNGFVLKTLEEIDHYIETGSLVVVACEDAQCADAFADAAYEHFTLRVDIEDIHARATLEKVVKEGFDYIIALSDHTCDVDEADAKMLRLLLHLRDISTQTGRSFVLVSELRDSQNQTLASSTQVNDFVIGSNLVCLMMTQISENRALHDVFDCLLSDEGSEIYMKHASDYVRLGQELDLYTATAAAARRGHLLLGYKKDSADGHYAVRVNVAKSEHVSFDENDYFIVLAEE